MVSRNSGRGGAQDGARGQRMRGRSLLLVWLAAASALTVFALGEARSAILSKENEARLALAQANHDQVISFAVATRVGETGQVALAIDRLGGRIRYRSDEIGFLEAALPTAQAGKLFSDEAIEAISISSFDKDQYYAGWFSIADETLDVRRADSGIMEQGNWPPAVTAHPLEHPYSILKDLDADRLRLGSPSFDGRGIVIGHVEFFPDFLLPELQAAYALDGRRIPKFIDAISTPDFLPSLEVEAPRTNPEWVKLRPAIGFTGLTALIDGAEYRLPRPGAYRAGELKIPNASPYDYGVHALLAKMLVKGSQAGALQRNEVVVFKLIWSDDEHSLWIDSNGDGDFSDEQPVQEYRLSKKFGILGRDDPKTAARDTIGYAVQKDGDYVSVSLGIGGHASAVAGAAAANKTGNGRIDGIAPGAQLLVISSGETAASVVRSMITAFVDPRTDLVLVEGRYPATGTDNLMNGSSAAAIILKRLVDRYRKPVFVTASNVPGMTTILDVSVPHNVASVGAYQSAASVLTNSGVKVGRPDDLHWSGSEGPAGNGALKPDFLAPANPITLTSSFRVGGGGEIPGLFKLPPGYTIGSGTSTATPVVTGAAALLMSAARQVKMQTDAEAIYRALRGSARFLPEIPAYKQGAGLIQVGEAWRHLQQDARSRDYIIEVQAPVRTATSHLLEVPNVGQGLFEREGWSSGDKALRKIILTRKTGPSEPVNFQLAWKGNDGTFSAAPAATLPLGVPTPIEIVIQPKGPGAHSAILSLVSENAPTPIKSIPLTVVAPHEFTGENSFIFEESIQLDRPGRRNIFFRVPPDTAAFTVEIGGRPKLGLLVQTPDNRGTERFLAIDPGTGKARLSIANPMEGVWQATLFDMVDAYEHDWSIEARTTLPPSTVQVRAFIHDVAASTTAQRGSAAQTAFVNRFAPFFGGVPHSSLGSLSTAVKSLGPNEHEVIELDIEEGTELLVAETLSIDPGRIDVDLRLYDCTTGKCIPSRYGDSYTADERVLIEHPRPGKWKVILSGSGTGNGKATFRYMDIFTHPLLGGLHAVGPDGKREPGETWRADLKLWRAKKPASGRRAVGVFYTRDRDILSFHKSVNIPAAPGERADSGKDVVPLSLELLELP